MFKLICHIPYNGKPFIAYSTLYASWEEANQWIKDHVKEDGYHLWEIIEVVA